MTGRAVTGRVVQGAAAGRGDDPDGEETAGFRQVGDGAPSQEGGQQEARQEEARQEESPRQAAFEMSASFPSSDASASDSAFPADEDTGAEAPIADEHAAQTAIAQDPVAQNPVQKGRRRTGGKRRRRGTRNVKTPDGRAYAAGTAGAPLAAAGAAALDILRALGQVLRAIGKFIATVWRLAGALDAALWHGCVWGARAAWSLTAASAAFVWASLVDLAEWLPTPPGRALSAFCGAFIMVCGLWIVDEIRAAAVDMSGPQQASRPPLDSDDPIVARVLGRYVRLSEIRTAAVAAGQLDAAAPLSRRAAFERGLVETVAEQRLLARAASEAGVARDPEVARRLSLARQRLLAAAYMEQRIAAATEPSRLQRFYESQADIVRLGDEVRARHIVVKTEEEAREIIRLLGGGADFAVLARGRSVDRSTAPRGGEIGYFTRPLMTPVLSNAAFTTPVGDLAPLFFSQHGWHVLQVLDRRPAPTLGFDSVEQGIKAFLIKETVDETIAELSAGDAVVYFPPSADEDADAGGSAGERLRAPAPLVR